MKNIRKFETTAEMDAAVLTEPYVLYNEETGLVKTNPDGGSIDYEYVDLGLSVKWATCNVGASSPEEYGLYFAWGETEGYTGITDTKKFAWSDYKYGTSSSNLTKYNSTDGKTVLELTDDAAHVNMGGNWRMPTKAEIQELLSNTRTLWTTMNGVKGIRFFLKSDTTKSIFMPAAGLCLDGSVSSAGGVGFSGSSSLDGSDVTKASYLSFSSSSTFLNTFSRYCGRSVRGVLE